jgi:hypothetical protein
LAPVCRYPDLDLRSVHDVLFMIYTSVAELNARLGKGELVKIFFTRSPSELKQTRLRSMD